MLSRDEQLVRRYLELTREFKLSSILFKNQTSFVSDESKRKFAICSRRAGKTKSIAVDLLMELDKPVEADCAYIGLTRGTAKKVMFNEILKLKHKYDLKITENRSDLTITNDKTKNTLYITGANSDEDSEKLRGLKLGKVAMDEVASFRNHLTYLIEEVIEPTLIDTNGTLILIGTPSANPTDENFFYRVTSGLEQGWSGHSWTILDNPHIPHAMTWLTDYKKRKGWGDDNPVYMREWLGRWTFDQDSLVYKYSKSVQDYDQLPSGHEWHYIIGCDLGFEDAFAITVMGFSYTDRKVYLVDEFKKNHMLPDQMAQEIIKMRNRWNPIRIVADQGGLGKAIVEEFNARYLLNILPAEKTKKYSYIEMMNGDLRTGSLKIKYETETAKEMIAHQWDPDKKMKEDDRTQNHCCDAALYSWRECKHYLGEIKEQLPPDGSKEHWERYEKELLESEIEQFNNQQKME